MHQQENIVVFRQFDNVIEANIIKSKLDAHGIPCFLTDENLANLYPAQPYLSIQARLHIFEKDVQQAQQIVAEGNLVVLDEHTTRCPQCQSHNLHRDFPKKESRNFLSGLHILFFGIFFPQAKIYRCQECQHEFDVT
jgi:DNA-directed RNA polymerase subunit RPC12/RpoP